VVLYDPVQIKETQIILEECHLLGYYAAQTVRNLVLNRRCSLHCTHLRYCAEEGCTLLLRKLLNVCRIHNITSQDSILCSHCKRMSHLTQKSGDMPYKQKVNTWHFENVLLPSTDVLNQAIFPCTQHTDHATIHLVSYQPPPVVDQVRYQGSSCMNFVDKLVVAWTFICVVQCSLAIIIPPLPNNYQPSIWCTH
jgi:hypothetical protein